MAKKQRIKPIKLKLPPYLNTSIPFSTRVSDLISRMTPEEKILQMVHSASGIPRLAVPEYNWWNEALHGVARAGFATVFPQAIGLAAIFDEDMMLRIGTVISDEARAKYHKAIKTGNREQYCGLTFWSPNINIFRDPRWGRGQETYGEDPYLTSRMAVAFINGLQGHDKKYLKTAACAKHFAVHSGPDPDRMSFDAKVNPKDMRETYLPAFEACVKEANVESIMAAYNRVNGVPACASRELLVDILRNEWGFTGHVVSDCSAIENIYLSHKYSPTPEAAAAAAIKAGCDINCCLDKCEGSRLVLKKAFAGGLISEADMDASLKRLFMTRMKLGMFDTDSKVKYSKIPFDIVDSREHKSFAADVSRASIVLLKNDGILPLKKSRINSITVTGPNADDVEVLLGNYHGTPSKPVTPLKGLMKTGLEVNCSRGCELTGDSKQGFVAAMEDAARSDVIVFCGGLSPKIEGEECDTGGFERSDLGLPGVQADLLAELKKTGKPVILVLLSGSALSIDPDKANAIIQAWYPGQSGGEAIADIIFGRYNPAGRLPVTVFKSSKDLPDFKDYSMENRTYKFFKGEPLYPFGYGLSYTSFAYSGLNIGKVKRGAPVEVSVEVTNTGKHEGDEVVQIYLKDVEASCRVPKHQLAGFQRVSLKPGQKKLIEFIIKPEQFELVNDAGKKIFEPGEFEVFVGGVQPGFVCETTMVVSSKFVL
jgi:beta-glucosidase